VILAIELAFGTYCILITCGTGRNLPQGSGSFAKAIVDANVFGPNQFSASTSEHVVSPEKPAVDWAKWIGVFCTVVLAGVGVFGICVALKTLKQIEHQTVATKLEAQAAKLSARAAKENIELFISKERARLGISLEDFKVVLLILPPAKTTFALRLTQSLHFGR
jgi:hypothetical protein